MNYDVAIPFPGVVRCAPNQLDCDGQCLSGDKRCDGVLDCSDFRDERDCGKTGSDLIDMHLSLCLLLTQYVCLVSACKSNLHRVSDCLLMVSNIQW